VKAVEEKGDFERNAFSIPEFCARNGISAWTFYKLQREGRGPRTMDLGAIRISRQAEVDWQREREMPGDAEARLIKRQQEARHRQTRAAAKKSVASPRHVSKRKARR
jgi:predicted DNA-binding transcriptional regulator AlpA